MLIFNEKAIREVNEDKGTVHTLTYMSRLGYKLTESFQKGDYFEGNFSTKNYSMIIKTYKDRITYVKIV